MSAFVYLIEEVSEGADSSVWTKIGYTKNPPEWRLYSNIRMGNPRTLRLPAIFEFADQASARGGEAAAHEFFRDRLHQKEWFRVNWKEVAEWCRHQGYVERPSKEMSAAISDPVPTDDPPS